VPDFWEYQDSEEYRKRMADELVRQYSTPAPQPSQRPLVSFLDAQGQVTPGSALSGALDVLQVPTEVIGKPLLGLATAALTPGQQIRVDPNANWWEQAKQVWEGARAAEEARPELFGWDIPENVPLVGGTHIGEKFVTENILADPLNWLGWGGGALAKSGVGALAKIGRVGQAIDLATTPLGWAPAARGALRSAAGELGEEALQQAPRWAASLVERYGPDVARRLATGAGAVQAASYLASAPALAAAAPWMLVEPALRGTQSRRGRRRRQGTGERGGRGGAARGRSTA
jgi:hypothetical protein